MSHWQRRDWEEEAVVRVGVGACVGVRVGAVLVLDMGGLGCQVSHEA